MYRFIFKNCVIEDYNEAGYDMKNIDDLLSHFNDIGMNETDSFIYAHYRWLFYKYGNFIFAGLAVYHDNKEKLEELSILYSLLGGKPSYDITDCRKLFLASIRLLEEI